MWRAPEIEKVLNSITKDVFGSTIKEAQEKATCLTCGKPVTGFVDMLSAKEYGISGMCQDCQDSVFTEDEEED